jgi:hypothetical protein
MHHFASGVIKNVISELPFFDGPQTVSRLLWMGLGSKYEAHLGFGRVPLSKYFCRKDRELEHLLLPKRVRSH